MILLPVHDEQEAENETAQVSEMSDATACSCHTGQEFYRREYKQKPLGLQ
jgi:hypothetical protein